MHGSEMKPSIIVRDLDYIVTMDNNRRILRKSSIYIEDTYILAIGEYNELRRKFGVADREIDGRGLIAIPGLINAHTHIAMCAMRGLASDYVDVIYRIFWPIEKAFTPEIVEKVATLGALEALKSGVTLLADHYFFMDRIAEALSNIGIRGLLGHTIMTWGGPWVGEDEFRKALDFVEKWRDRSSLIKPVLAPHSPETVSIEWFKDLKEISGREGLPIHMHLAQSERELKVVKERTGTTPVRLIHDIGILGPQTLAAHCIYIDDWEKSVLANTGTLVVQCPTTYMLSGTFFHAIDLLRLGGKVLLGTDAPCYNDNIDVFEEARSFIYAQRLQKHDPAAIKAEEVFSLVTSRAAENLGLRELGSIAIGKKADIVLLDRGKPHLNPIFNVISNIVYSSTMGDVHTVIVDGEVVLENFKSTRVNEGDVVRKGREASKKLLRRALDISPELEDLLGTIPSLS